MFVQRLIGSSILLAAFFPLGGCLNTHHTVDANVSPIYVTLDINLRVQQELDDFFGDLDRKNPLLEEDETDGPSEPSVQANPEVTREPTES